MDFFPFSGVPPLVTGRRGSIAKIVGGFTASSGDEEEPTEHTVLTLTCLSPSCRSYMGTRTVIQQMIDYYNVLAPRAQEVCHCLKYLWPLESG